MKKHYKEVWFWLMIISILLSVLLLLYLYSQFKFTFLSSECFWVAIGSIGTLISVITATHSIKNSEIIRKQKDTYEAFNAFKQRNFDRERQIENYPINRFAENHADAKENHETEMEEINEYLCEIEQFATCVNTGVFDVKTVYNMGGPFIIDKFKFLYPLISSKRQSKNRKTIYLEFEKMVDALLKIQTSNLKAEQEDLL